MWRRHQWQLIALSPQVRNQSLRRKWKRLQLPNTDGELACRPLLPKGGDADLHGTATTLRGGFRNNGNADTGLDHTANRVDAVDANPHLHRRTQPRGMAGKVELQRTFARKANEMSRDHLAEPNLPTFRQFIVTRHNERGTIGSKRKLLQRIRQGSVGRYADIDGPRGDSSTDIGTFLLFQIAADGSVGCQKRSQRLRYMLVEGRSVGQDLHTPGEASRVAAKLSPQSLNLLANEPGMFT